MSTPLDFSVLYVREPQRLRAVFANTAEYLRGDATVSGGGDAVVNYMDYGIQLGRRFRALKAWMVFRTFGSEGIIARIREHRRLAEAFADRVRGSSGFELTAPVTMAVVCFRHSLPDMTDVDADAHNERIVEAVNAGGAAYLTHTRLRGRSSMRVGIGNIETTDAHLDVVWRAIAHEIQSRQQRAR